jgi:tetratricopeptide (TPR) repeat protein
LNTSATYLIRHPNKPSGLSNLGISWHTRFKLCGDLSDLENAIANNQKAVDLTDDRHQYKPMYLTNLGNSHGLRFGQLGDLSDLENAISNKAKAVALTDNRHPYKPRYLSNLGNSQGLRFERLGELSDLEDAIHNIESAIDLIDDGDPHKPTYLLNLGTSLQARFQHLRNKSDLESAILNIEKAVALTSDDHPRKPGRLSSLGSSQQTRFEHFGNLPDLEKSILNIKKAIELTDDRHLRKPMYLSNLGKSQELRFEHLHDLSDLESAISYHQEAVKLTDDAYPPKVVYLSHLGRSLRRRLEHLHQRADLEASLFSFKAAAQLKAAYPQQALSAAQQWAITSHKYGDLVFALEGYRTALELLPKVAWLGLTTSSRHDWLLREKSENLGCLAATCAIQLGSLEEAVELLDLGRSVFWQQASSLRSDLEKLRKAAPKLTKELERVGQLLDARNFSDSAFTIGEDDVRNGQHNAEEVVKERRRLVGEWEALVERVRQLPQFEYFLQPIAFHQLRQAFSAGQVIIINASQFGVDALIFNATGPVEHVSLPDIDLETLTTLSSDLVLERPQNASETQRRSYTKHFLKPTLRLVWNDILVHIFDRIHIPLTGTDSEMPPSRRIWWYLTGPLTFIPIHAAGPGRRSVDVSQMVVSSYMTSLGSHFQAQKKSVQARSGPLKFLSISQSETPGKTPLLQTMQEVDKVAQVFQSSGWLEEDIICLHGPDATVDRVSCALDTCSLVHFACHGSQNLKLGMKSAFLLHDGYLELSDIASKTLPAGQFAFLSACDAASGITDLPGEAVHLAAGIQFAGFPSVVATLWRIRDEDAPKVADHTYRYLFRNGLQGLDPSEAATALNRAVLRLRDNPDITVDRWAPFVHFGI